MQHLEARRALLAFGQLAHSRGWVPASSGNFSVRTGANECLMTVSGRHKGHLTEADFLRCDWQARAIDDNRKASAEALLHTQLYARDATIGAVLHVHSVTSTRLSMQALAQGQTHIKISGYELLKAFPPHTTHDTTLHLPIFANTQDMPALAAEVEAYMQQHGQGHAYLIAGHGCYTWARNLEQCVYQVEALEFLLACIDS